MVSWLIPGSSVRWKFGELMEQLVLAVFCKGSGSWSP